MHGRLGGWIKWNHQFELNLIEDEQNLNYTGWLGGLGCGSVGGRQD